MTQRISARTIAVSTLIAALVLLNAYQYFSAESPGPTKPEPRQSAKKAAPYELPPPPTQEDQRVIDRFHQLAYDQQFRFMKTRGNFQVETPEYKPSRWLGVITQQNPSDFWINQEIITELKPDFIVETGTLMGGGALLWATILAQVNPEGRVITIDIQDLVRDAKEHPLWKAKVEQVVKSSTDPEIVAKIKERVEGKTVIFILDSDHSKDHVLAELKAYAPMVGVGSYVLVQDSNINGHPVLPDFGPGPYEAIEEFLAGDDRFVADRTRERYLFTMHPKGFLKRIK